MQDLLAHLKAEFDKVLEVVFQDLAMVKTGRAKPALVEQVMVEAYEGQPKMKLVELASITSPDPQQLVIKPWDQSVLEAVEKAISKASQLQFNPVIDGDLIRIAIPQLTEDRRRDLVKLVKQKLESGKVMLRQARQRTKEAIDRKKGEADVSEDDIHKAIEELNKLTDEYVTKIDGLGEVKEKELMTV